MGLKYTAGRTPKCGCHSTLLAVEWDMASAASRHETLARSDRISGYKVFYEVMRMK